MARIYVSASTQDANLYATGKTNEEREMRAVGALVVKYLIAAGHKAKLGGAESAKANVADSNAYKPDLHLALHTNAGGGKGTEVYHFPLSAKGKKAAKAVYARVAKWSNEVDRGVKASATFIETRGPKAPAIIVEAVFHDRKSEALEVIGDHDGLARAVAQGVLDVYGGKLISTFGPSKPVVTPPGKPIVEVVPAVWAVAGQSENRIVLVRK